MSLTKTQYVSQDSSAIAEMTRRSRGRELGDQVRSQVGRPGFSGAFGRPLLFQVPVGDMHETAPRRIAGIGPAETVVQQVLERIPHGAACRTRRVDIEAPQGPVGSRDPARCQKIDLKPAQMRMCRGKDRRSTQRRDAGKADFGPKPHRQIDRAACRRIAAVERGDIDIFGRERHHGGTVFQQAGCHTDCGARLRRIAHQDFRRRIPAHHHDAPERRLGHGRGGHVFHGVLSRRPLGILCIFRKAHQHCGAPLSRASSRTSDHGMATCRNARSIATRCACSRSASMALSCRWIWRARDAKCCSAIITACMTRTVSGDALRGAPRWTESKYWLTDCPAC